MHEPMWVHGRYYSTFVALVAGVALGAALSPVAALVLVARPAHREPALGARHEGAAVLPRPNIVAARAAHLGGLGLGLAGVHGARHFGGAAQGGGDADLVEEG